MRGSNQTSRAIIRGGANTGRFDRGEDVPNAGDVTLRDPVSQGPIETHALYGAATPNVGSAWALPRAHPLWAPMDFECKELTKETPAQREERLARFEPPAEPRRQLTSEEIVDVRNKCRAHFASKKIRKRAASTLWHQTSSRAKKRATILEGAPKASGIILIMPRCAD